MYDISIYITNLFVQSKIMIEKKWTYPLPPSTVFLIGSKLSSLMRLWNFQTFSLFLLTFYEKLRFELVIETELIILDCKFVGGG